MVYYMDCEVRRCSNGLNKINDIIVSIYGYRFTFNALGKPQEVECL